MSPMPGWFQEDVFGRTEHSHRGAGAAGAANTLSAPPRGYLTRQLGYGFPAGGPRNMGIIGKRAAGGAAAMGLSLLADQLVDPEGGIDERDMLFAGLSGLAPLAAGRTRRGIGWMAALPLVAQLVPEIFDRMNGPEKPSFP